MTEKLVRKTGPRHRNARVVTDFLLPLVATGFGLIVIFPLLWSFMASFFPIGDFTTWPPRLVPSRIEWDNYARAIKESMLLRFMANSLATAAGGTAIRMTVAILAAFAAAFLSFKGRNFLFIVILSTMLIPSDALLIENYLTIQRFGLLDTWFGIVSIYLLAPTQIFMLRQVFKTIPHEFREAAAIDGCGDIRFLTRIVLPMARPVALALTLQSFTSIWNAYLWPLLVTNTARMRTVQVGITMLGFSESLDFGPTFAAISLVTAPVVIAFMALRKKIVEGVAASGLVG